MSTFLFASWGFSSHVDPFVAVAGAVRRSGHDVFFYTSAHHQETVERAGCRFLPFRELSQERAEATVNGVLQNRRRPVRLWRHWRQFLIDSIPAQVGDIRRCLAESRADVLVSEIALWGPLAVLHETERIPVAILSHVGLCLEPGEPLGPVAGGAMPPRRTAGQKLEAALRGMLASRVSRDARSRVNALRSYYGLPPQNLRMTQLCGTMDLYLIPTCASFDYNRTDLPANVRYVGPCLHPAPPAPYPPPESRGRIVVDEGALFPIEQTMIQAALEGLGDHDVTVLNGQGRRDLPAARCGRVTVQPWRPVQEIIHEASLLVTNGNSDSVMAALFYGVPMVVVPSILDQFEVAYRVQESRAGVLVPERRCSPETLRAAVGTVLGDRSYRQNAERLAGELRALGGPETAAAHLAELAAVRARSAAPVPS